MLIWLVNLFGVRGFGNLLYTIVTVRQKELATATEIPLAVPVLTTLENYKYASKGFLPNHCDQMSMGIT